MMNEKKEIRNSNIELLRMIAIILIIAHHYVYCGFDMNNINEYYSINKYIIDILFLGGKLGNNIFILISAYFMVETKFSIKKFLRIEAEVLFYSWIFLIIFTRISISDVTINAEIIKQSIFPVIYGHYWFITSYIILMILSPFLNIFIKNVKKEDFNKLLFTLICVWSILPILFNTSTTIDGMGWFILLYLIGGYIKKYPEQNIKNKKHIVSLIIWILILILTAVIPNDIGHKFNSERIMNYSRKYSYYYSPILLIISIKFLIIFKNMKVKQNKLINKIASTSLGVYLIHCNKFCIPIIFHNILRCSEMYYSNFLIIHAIISIIFIYCNCIIIELTRQYIFERIYLKLDNKRIRKLKLIIKNKYDIIKTKILKNYYEEM